MGLRVVAVGGRSFVSAFRLAGVEGFEVGSPEELVLKLEELVGLSLIHI